MTTLIMFTEKDRSNLSALLASKDYEKFMKGIDSFRTSEQLAGSVSDLHEEWRKLQIASRNGLMDDDQVHLAFSSFFRKKSAEMFAIQESN